MDPRDVPPEHGSTVLPGVPLPPHAIPHGPVQPEGAAAPAGPPEPAVEPFPGAEPRPAVPAAAPAAAVVAGAAAADAAAPAAPAPAPKVPWWKKEIGGRKQAPAAMPPAALPPASPPADVPAPVAPAPPPTPAAAAPRDEPEAERSASTPDEVLPAAAAAAPAAPASGRGRHAAPEPEPQGRRTLLLIIAVGAVLVALAVALFVWPGLLAGGDDEAQGAVAPTAAPVALAVPDRLAGLPRIAGAADEALQDRLASTPVEGLDDPVGAVYGTDGKATLQVIAWRAVDPPAQDSVEAAFAGFEGSGGAAVSDVQELPAGDLGGHIACAATTAQGADAVQCFWADAQSFGSISVLGPKDRASAHATALQARAGVETR